MRDRQRFALVMAGISAVLLTGCAPTSTATPQRVEPGYVLLLPGVENYAWTARGLLDGLRDAGVPPVEVNQWGDRPFGTFRNLRRYERNRQRAAAIAADLAAYQQQHPNVPITLIGYSGGGAMALFAAEALPEGVTLERIILLGAAVAPEYDPRKALGRCRRGIVSYYSERDWFMLGWGTRTFGTMERVRSDAAGRRGFRDSAGELLVLPGFEQVAWRKEWARLGNDGSHNGWMSRAWAREVLARDIIAVPEAVP